MTSPPGPLGGIRVVELAGLGPGPFCAMLLADLGAHVVTVDRPDPGFLPPIPRDPLSRGKRSMVVDLKDPAGLSAALDLVAQSDVLVDPFRPGVAERLGLGPDECLGRNPGLIYGRVTGWGQDGPMAGHAGHDINYIALAGALEGLGRAGQPPTPPANLLGDFGGGGMLLALGIAAALVERASSGRGQIVDAAMIDGGALLTSFTRGQRLVGRETGARGTNMLDTGWPAYDVYETSDRRWVSVGCVEPQFWARLLSVLGIDDDPDLLASHGDPTRWPVARATLASAIGARTSDEWTARFSGETETCFAPVLTLDEAPLHPHHVARGTFVEIAGVEQGAPAPRFSRTPLETPRPGPTVGEHTGEVLGELGR